MRGEHDRGSNTNTLQPGSQQQSINKTKRHNEEPDESDKSSKRKLRTKLPVNYRYLNDPFSDDEEETNHENPATTYQATLGTEDPKTVNEAKQLDDWPEWEKAIKAELDQLNNLGTWELVECPKDAIPIPNKWVFITTTKVKS